MDVNINSITGVPYATPYFNEISLNPVVLLIVTVILIAYYALFATFGTSEQAATAGKQLIRQHCGLRGAYERRDDNNTTG